MSCFHVNDNSTAVPRNQDGFDKLHKIRPILDFCREKFFTVYQPEREVAIDETMVPWTWRLSFKMYDPIKPEKYGVKLFQLCESSTGYNFAIFMYMPGKMINYNRIQDKP